MESTVRSDSGREFQIKGPETQNALSPNLERSYALFEALAGYSPATYSIKVGPSFSKSTRILYRLRDIATYWSKIAKFCIPYLYLAPKQGVTKFEFRKIV